MSPILELHEETATIGGAMTWGAAPMPPEVMALEPEHFYSPINGQIWTAIAELIGKGSPVDEVGVCSILKSWDMPPGTLAAVCAMAYELPTAANLGHWASIVLESGRKRLLKTRLADAAAVADAGGDLDDMLARVNDAVKATNDGAQSGGLVHISEPIREANAIEAARRTDPYAGLAVTTGIYDLDDRLKLAPGDLTLLAARPSMGKTSLAMNIATHNAKDLTRGSIAVFSLEQTGAALAARILKHSGNAASMDLYVDDRGSLTVAEIAAAVQRIGKVRLVIVDYLQLMRLPKKSDRRDVEIGDLTKGLKALAKDLGAHVIALSQLNRSVEKRSPPIPVISDLRDSGNLEEDADNVVMLYREEYYKPQSPDAKGKADIIIGKQRNGPTGIVRAAWVAHRTSFENLSRREAELPL